MSSNNSYVNVTSTSSTGRSVITSLSGESLKNSDSITNNSICSGMKVDQGKDINYQRKQSEENIRSNSFTTLSTSSEHLTHLNSKFVMVRQIEV